MKKPKLVIGKGRHVRACCCLNCGKALDGVTSVATDKDYRVSPGSITICFYCGHIMAFDAQMQLRELSDSEVQEVAGHPLVLAIQKARKLTGNTS